MAWGTWTLGTQTTIRLGNFTSDSSLGLVIDGRVAPELDSLLNSPMTRGLVEIVDTSLSPVGAAADFSMLPKWRKAVRQIG